MPEGDRSPGEPDAEKGTPATPPQPASVTPPATEAPTVRRVERRVGRGGSRLRFDRAGWRCSSSFSRSPLAW